MALYENDKCSIYDLDIDFYEYDDYESESTDVEIEYTNRMIEEDISLSPYVRVGS